MGRAIIAYELVDALLKRVIKRYPVRQRNAARRRRDKLDMEYGAYRYSVREVFEEIEGK